MADPHPVAADPAGLTRRGRRSYGWQTVDCLDTLTRLGIAAAAARLTPHWQASMACRPAAPPGFLVPAQISENRRFAGLPADIDPCLHRVAGLVVASPDLCALAWHCQRLLYDELDYRAHENCAAWPQRIDPLGDDTGAFYLLIALEAIPRMRAVHASRGIPAQVTGATCTHFPASLERYRQHHRRRVGVRPHVLYWLRNHTSGKLYCLGRLEYMLKPFAGGLTAWRHRSTGTVLALAADGSHFDAEGFVTDPDETQGGPPGDDPRGAAQGDWTARVIEGADAISGSPIAPTGVAEHRQVTLRRDAWQRVLTPGDLIYEVHIPAGGGMTLEACRDSMRQAIDFFPRYVPGRQAAGFACGSWILNPELAQIYSAASNMVVWQRELYLYPIRSGRRSGLYFIFGTDEVDPATAPRDTSLRRALLDHMARGGRLIGGGMFFLLDDFERFGQQVYRRGWPDLDHLARPVR